MRYRIICLTLFFVLSVFVSLSFSGIFESRGYGSISGPFLLSPTTGDIDLTGKEYLEFRWERGRLIDTDYFDFRLYKGHDTTESGLIFKQRYSTSEFPIKIPASSFEVNQVYTWVLRQVFNSGDKSDKSFSSFKVIKK